MLPHQHNSIDNLTGRLAHECDIVGIATKVFNVFANPMQCEHLVVEAKIAGVVGGRTVEKAKGG